MKKQNKPSYSLDEIKELLCKTETRVITRRDRQEAARLGYADDDDMVKRVLRLVPSEFKKTMPSEKIPTLMQDVYNTLDDSTTLYIKLQIVFNGQGWKGVIVSFKEK